MEEYVNANPVVLLFILCLGILMLMLPRRYAVVPMFIAAMSITLGQNIVIATGNFTMIRLLVAFGFLRLVVRKEYDGFSPNPIDKAMLYWIASSVITYTFLWWTVHSLVNRMGLCFDSIGVYFLCRMYVRNFTDFARVVRVCALLLAPFALLVIYEFITGKNLFAVLGGVPDLSEIRNGRVRCQGSFRHPILMGTFGATMLPLLVSLWWQKRGSKRLLVLGMASAGVITVCSGSSGAVMVAFYGVVGMCFWFLRNHMKTVRWALVGSLILMQLKMDQPVWYLFARLGTLTGGTGWHRAYLIDQSIRYFNEWWLVGVKVTAHWMPSGLAADPTRADITNHYLLQGVNGGLVTMLLFILILVRCYQAIGMGVGVMPSFPLKFLVWCMGAALFAHTLAFLSVSYFDQIQVFWYFLLAAIAMSRDRTEVRRVWMRDHAHGAVYGPAV